MNNQLVKLGWVSIGWVGEIGWNCLTVLKIATEDSTEKPAKKNFPENFWNFFFWKKKKRRQLKKLEIWVGGQKPFLRRWGSFWNASYARGVIIFFSRGGSTPLAPPPLLTYDLN